MLGTLFIVFCGSVILELELMISAHCSQRLQEGKRRWRQWRQQSWRPWKGLFSVMKLPMMTTHSALVARVSGTNSSRCAFPFLHENITFSQFVMAMQENGECNIIQNLPVRNLVVVEDVLLSCTLANMQWSWFHSIVCCNCSPLRAEYD